MTGPLPVTRDKAPVTLRPYSSLHHDDRLENGSDRESAGQERGLYKRFLTPSTPLTGVTGGFASRRNVVLGGYYGECLQPGGASKISPVRPCIRAVEDRPIPEPRVEGTRYLGVSY